MNERPVGIIRTLPALYGDASAGAKRYKKSIAWLERGHLDQVLIAMQVIPRQDVLYMYLIIDGHVDVRLNIAGYIPGFKAECWDKAIRQPNWWAVCTAPVVRPEEPVKRRGFQGFHYVKEGELF